MVGSTLKATQTTKFSIKAWLLFTLAGAEPLVSEDVCIEVLDLVDRLCS